MQELQELKSLSFTIDITKGYEKESEQKWAFLRKCQLIFQKYKWDFVLTKASVENCLFWGGIYVAIYLAAFVLFIGLFWQWDVMNHFVGWIFDFNEPTLRHTSMYYIGFPATWIGGLIIPWIRDTGPSLQSAFGFRYIPRFFAGVVVTFLLAIIGCTVIDFLKMILRTLSTKQINQKQRISGLQRRN